MSSGGGVSSGGVSIGTGRTFSAGSEHPAASDARRKHTSRAWAGQYFDNLKRI